MPSSITMRMTVRHAQVLPRDVSRIKSTLRAAFAVTAVAARAALDLGRNLHVAEKRFDLATLAIHALKVDFFATILLRIQRRIRKDGSQERKWQECGGKPSGRSMARRKHRFFAPYNKLRSLVWGARWRRRDLLN